MENSVTTPVAPPSLYEKNKLRIAGALNAIGDIGLLADGFKSKSIPFKAAGWLYTAGALIATFFGASSKEQQKQDLTERAAEFVQSFNPEKTPDLESARILQQKDTGIMASIGRSLRRHSGQIMLALYTLGAGAMLWHGVNGYKSASAEYKLAKDEGGNRFEKATAALTEAKGTIGYGISSLSIKALSLFVKEDTAQEKASPNTTKGVIGWFKEKPMRIFGYGSLITETMMGIRTYGKYKQSIAEAGTDKKTNWGFSALTTGAYALSDLVIAGTNKDAANAVGKMTDAEQAKLENMVAETIAVQPEEQRERLSAEAAEFLKKESIVNGSADQLRESILQRATKLWSERKSAATAEIQRA